MQRLTGRVQLTIVWNTDPHLPGTSRRKSDELLDQFISTIIKLSRNISPSTAQSSSAAGCVNVVDGGVAGDAFHSSSFFHSIYVNYHAASRHCNLVTGRGGEDTWRLMYGSDELTEIVESDMASDCGAQALLHFPPNVFRQANLDQFSEIIRNIRLWIRSFRDGNHNNDISDYEGNKRNVYCLELYGGVGTIGLNCADLVKKLVCSDENPFNKGCFEKSVELLPKRLRKRLSYNSAPAESAVFELFNSENNGFNVVIVDPPRKGLDVSVIKSLLLAGNASENDSRRYPKRLIYVSCGFKALKRDISLLLGHAELPDVSTSESNIPSNVDCIGCTTRRYWNLVHAEGHVLFPGSDHMETLAVFDRP